MFKVVPADTAYVVERLGRYHRTLHAGTHFLTPFIDHVAFRYSLLPAETELADECITLDNIPVRVTSAIRWQIVDPQKAAYASASVIDFVKGIIRTNQRQWIARQRYDDARASTRDLGAEVMRATANSAEQSGAKILGIEVHPITRA